MNRQLIFAGLVAGLTLLSPATMAADPADKDVIEYRRHIMQALNEQAAILGEMASYAIPKDNLNAHLQAVADLASTALRSFVPKVPGGQAVPEVWTHWADFSQRMQAFAQKTAQAARNAPGMPADAALAGMLDVLNCDGCHKAYRDETK